MKKKLIVLALIPMLASCSISLNSSESIEESSDKPSSSSSSSSSSQSDSMPSGISESSPIQSSSNSSADPGVDPFDVLFDHSSKVNISLSFSDASLKALSDYGSSGDKKYYDAYFPADFHLELNGTSYDYPEVGVRMKGNTSRTAIVGSDNNIYGSCHFKVSFKETFDSEIYNDSALVQFKKSWSDDTAREERKDRDLFGLKKLDLKYVPRNLNSCILREIYVYDCFRNEGIFAPYANYSTLTVKNETTPNGRTGAYEIVEPIDKPFLKKRLGKQESKGDLYKCVYNGMGKADLSRSDAVNKTIENELTVGERVAYGKIGVEDNYNYYVPCYQLKTNDSAGEGSDFSKMANFINTVWNLTYGGWANDDSHLDSILDVDQFLKFSAMSYLFGNFDDQRYNYNNYYIYFLPSSGKAIYIPYDWDWCLGLDTGQGMENIRPLDDYTLDGGKPASIYYDVFLGGNPDSGKISYDRSERQSRYLSYISQYIADGVLNPDNFVSLANQIGVKDEISSVTSYMNAKKMVAQ